MAKAVGKIDHYYVIHDPKIQGGEPIIRGTRFLSGQLYSM